MRNFASRLIGHLRANPIAWVALFIALGTGAYAANTLPKNSVKSKTIKNGQVKTKDLAKNAVDSAEIRADAVKGPQIAPGAVGSVQIEDGSIAVGDLSPAAQPDKDLDLLRTNRIAVDDPADGAPVTTATIINYGPFTFTGRCQDTAGSALVSFTLTSTEAGHVTTSSSSPDSFAAGETRALLPNALLNTNSTTVGGGYAISASGRFINLAILVIGKTGGADCVFQASGWGG